jgi:hypothetical protein
VDEDEEEEAAEAGCDGEDDDGVVKEAWGCAADEEDDEEAPCWATTTTGPNRQALQRGHVHACGSPCETLEARAMVASRHKRQNTWRHGSASVAAWLEGGWGKGEV